jgi:hypothetical protein
MPDWAHEIDRLHEHRVELAAGLTEAQLSAAELHHSFKFPPDLRDFLSAVLPVGDGFPDWRAPDSDELRGRFAWPLDGLLFDVEKNHFWWPEWGRRPDADGEALALVRARFPQLPRLVPVYTHRYIPADPSEAGNPIFSVYQTDVIYYGSDLRGYIAHEFAASARSRAESPQAHRRIPFWSALATGDIV